MTTTPQPHPDVPLPVADDERVAELVVANQILYDRGVLDGFGHVSVRSASNPAHFWMARGGLAPEQVRHDDVIELDEDSGPVQADGRVGPGERFIHSEIYRARPDVYAVLHSHTDVVLPFAVTRAPLQAVIHTAYFLGSQPAPVFEIRDSMGDRSSMLVDNPTAGAALAQVLGQRSVALMRGHGLVVVGPSIRDVVFRGVYTRVNAEIETAALALGQPEFLNEFEVDRHEPVSMQWQWWAGQAAARRT